MRILTQRRLVGVATFAVGISALSVVAAGSAQADVLGPPSITQVIINAQDSPGCTGSGGGVSGEPEVGLTADGVPRSASLSASGMVTNDINPADVTTVSASFARTVTINQAGGQLSSISVNDTVSVNVAAALGNAQQCNVSVQVGANSMLSFDLVRPAYVTVKNVSRELVTTVLISGSTPSGVEIAGALAGGKQGTATSTGLLPAGSYAAYLVSLGASAMNTNKSGGASIEITFDEPGIATGKAKGPGKKYVTLPDADNCANNTAVLTWKKKAGKKKNPKVKKAVFKVDGVKVGQAKAKSATKGRTTTLKKLPATRAFTIEGTITLRSGKKVTVRRDYQACS